MGKLLNADIAEDYANITAFGKSGTGKTTLGVSAPQPFIMLSERQGFRSVRDAARMLSKPVPPTLYLESAADLRNCLMALQSDPDEPIATALREVLGRTDEVEEQIAALPYLKPYTVVSDSMTDFMIMISNEILDEMGNPTSGSDGLEVKPDRYWGLLRDKCEKLIRTLRDLPYNVLMIALLDDRETGKDENRERVVSPQTIMRALSQGMVAASNASGLCFVEESVVKDEDDNTHFEYIHKVRFAGPSWMMVKPMRALSDIEEPDVTDWLSRVEKQDEEDGLHHEEPPPEPTPEEKKAAEDKAKAAAKKPKSTRRRRRRSSGDDTTGDSKTTDGEGAAA